MKFLRPREAAQIPNGRTPHGVRGLKSLYDEMDGALKGRTPHGVRGLKFDSTRLRHIRHESHPARGAWIEIFLHFAKSLLERRRTPHGVRGLKLYTSQTLTEAQKKSHPARGAWIEIVVVCALTYSMCVAPRTGCVD